MSEFKELFERLGTDSNLNRRDFMRHSALAGLALSPLASLLQKVRAQGDEIVGEEIIVYGSELESLGREMVKKMQAQSLATTADNLGNAAMAMGGVAWGGAIATVEVPVISVLLVLDGMVFVIAGAGWYFLAHLLRMIAADPPRYPYEIDAVLNDSFFVPRVLEELKVDLDKMLLSNTDDLVSSLRAVWDHLEWWQAAKEEENGKWMELHSERYWSNIDAFAESLQTLSGNIRATLESLESRLSLPGNQSIFDATAKMAGQRLGDIKPIRELLTRAINWDSKLFDNGVREAVRQRLQDTVLQPVSQAELKALLDDLDKGARYFASV